MCLANNNRCISLIALHNEWNGHIDGWQTWYLDINVMPNIIAFQWWMHNSSLLLIQYHSCQYQSGVSAAGITLVLQSSILQSIKSHWIEPGYVNSIVPSGCHWISIPKSAVTSFSGSKLKSCCKSLIVDSIFIALCAKNKQSSTYTMQIISGPSHLH